MNKKLSLALRWIFLILVLVVIYMPIALIIVYSFSSEKNIGNSFGTFTFSLYARLFTNKQLMSATINTLIIGLVSALLATVIVSAVGFLLLSIFLRDVLKLPLQRGVGWLIVAHTVMTTPYVILTVSPRLAQLNPNLYEAGLDLGAGPMRTLFTVIVPQLVGGMISGFALAFTLSLDDFVVTNLNKGTNGVNTVSTYVYASLRRNLDPAIRALSTILFVSVLAVLIIVNIVKKSKAKKQG